VYHHPTGSIALKLLGSIKETNHHSLLVVNEGDQANHAFRRLVERGYILNALPDDSDSIPLRPLPAL
jgi:hypothetical protein